MMETLLQAGRETLAITGRTLPIIAASLIVVELLSAYGLLRKLQGIFSPLVRLGRLPAEAGPALAASIGSTLTADTVIASHYRSGRLDRGQALLSAEANTLPGYVTETFTYMLPVMAPALGHPVGWFYLSAFLFAGILKAIFVVLGGRWLYHRRSNESGNATPDEEEFQIGTKTPGEGLRRACKLFVKVAAMLTATSFVMAWIHCGGLLDKAAVLFSPFLAWIGLEESLFLPVLGYAASPMAGAAAVGALYKGGAVGAQAATVGALAGSLLSLPVFTLRYSMARHIAVFGPKLGSLNVAVSLVLGMTARLTVLLLVPAIYEV